MAQTKIVVDQLENESMQDFIKFLVFLELGATRTLSLAYKKYYEYDTSHEASQAWHTMAEKYRWTSRVTAYEELQSSKQTVTAAKHKQ